MANLKPLTLLELKDKAPSIFTNTKSPRVSDKYTFIPSIKVVKDMNELGWKAYDVSQRKARSSADSPFTKHMIRFRNEEIGRIGDSLPEVILTNSHDGRNAFTLHAGLFRLICSNGLVIADTTFQQVKIKHQWYELEEIRKVTNTMIEKVPTIVKHITKLDSISLNEEEKLEFAAKAILSRWPKGNEKYDLDDLLFATRTADKGDSIWKVYNVIQEKLIKGGLVFNNDKGKQQKLRPIINIDQQININKQLWSLTESYVA